MLFRAVSHDKPAKKNFHALKLTFTVARNRPNATNHCFCDNLQSNAILRETLGPQDGDKTAIRQSQTAISLRLNEVKLEIAFNL